MNSESILCDGFCCFLCGCEFSSGKSLSVHLNIHWKKQDLLHPLLKGNLSLWLALVQCEKGVVVSCWDEQSEEKREFFLSNIVFLLKNQRNEILSVEQKKELYLRVLSLKKKEELVLVPLLGSFAIDLIHEFVSKVRSFSKGIVYLPVQDADECMELMEDEKMAVEADLMEDEKMTKEEMIVEKENGIVSWRNRDEILKKCFDAFNLNNKERITFIKSSIYPTRISRFIYSLLLLKGNKEDIFKLMFRNGLTQSENFLYNLEENSIIQKTVSLVKKKISSLKFVCFIDNCDKEFCGSDKKIGKEGSVKTEQKKYINCTQRLFSQITLPNDELNNICQILVHNAYLYL